MERCAGRNSSQDAFLPRKPPGAVKCVLIGHGIANAVVPLSLARSDFRLFYTAGLSVRMYTYAATHRIHPHMLRDINRWVMEAINDAE